MKYSKSVRIRLMLRLLLLSAALVLISYLGLVSVRSVIAYRDVIEAKDLLVSVEGSLDRAGLDVTSDQLDDVEVKLEEARGKVRSASGFLSSDPALWVARKLPWLGGQINSARELAQAGLDGVEIGMDGVQAMRKLLAVKDEGSGPLGQKAIRFLDDVEPEIERIEERLGEMRAIQDELQSRTLIAPLSAAVDELGDSIARIEDHAETYRRAQVLAPGLLGQERPMTYLVLGQDNNEIAATGGLILSYGVITVDRGRITDMFFEGTEEQIARWQEQTGGEYVEPPAPLKRYLLRKYTWNLGTANWSPDFPTAAQQAELFYEKGGGGPVDGVIAIDFVAMEALLRVVGPVRLWEEDVEVTGDNVTGLVLKKTRKSQVVPGESRKAFAAATAEAVLQKVLATDSDHLGSLLEVLGKLANGRHLLVFAKEEKLQKVVEEIGWGGEIKSYDGDYLMLVDSSVHHTKGNLILEQEVAWTIELGSDGSARHHVAVHDVLPVEKWERRDPGLAFAIGLRRRYGSFLRLLVPPDSTLIGTTVNGSASDAEMEHFAARRSFGTHFHLFPDESATVTYEYISPRTVTAGASENEYRLFIQKQGGVPGIPVNLQILLPEGAEFRRGTLNGDEVAGLADIPIVLTEDVEISVIFTSPGAG